VKPNVVREEGLRVVDRRKHPGDLVRHRRDVILTRTFSRKAGGADLEDPAHFVHLVAREAVERGKKAEGLAAKNRRAVGDEGPGSAARSHNPQRGELAQAGPNRRPADPKARRQLALGRQPIARVQRPALDEAAHVRNDLVARPRRSGSLHRLIGVRRC
jgi:hypothetical protein